MQYFLKKICNKIINFFLKTLRTMDLRQQKKLEELKNFLTDNGWSQQKLAEKLGVSRQTVNNLLNGQTNFGRLTAINWSDLLGIRASWLMTGEGEMMAAPVSENNEKEDTANLIAKANLIHAQNYERLISIIENQSKA